MMISAIFGTIIALILILLFRNNEVYNFRIRVIDEESEFSKKRIAEGKGFEGFRKYNYLRSYNEMLLKFWIPLKKFDVPIEMFYEEKDDRWKN